MDDYRYDTNHRRISPILFSSNAYLALWFLYFELFDHYRTNSRRLALLSKVIKSEADAIAIKKK